MRHPEGEAGGDAVEKDAVEGGEGHNEGRDHRTKDEAKDEHACIKFKS